jgi:class 3 adenylate cyclase/tetratricopeptide (TPR) repeat protein
MLCRHCNSDNRATNAFCDRCGKPLGIVCVACGHQNRPNSRFCGKCSAPLATTASNRPSTKEVLRVLSAKGGERKHLTMMFADISNSTTLIDHVDPEDAMRRIQPAIDAMKRSVEAYGGIVNKVQGDGIMALFGAPVAHEDHAVRASAAALEIQSSVTALGDPDVRIRVGIHTGDVVVQAVDNSLYQTYDVAGSAAHLASRMEQMAEPGEILLTADTVGAAKQYVEAASLGYRVVRGLSEPIEIFRLLHLRHAPASVIFRSQPRLSPLIGRATQLEALEAELTNVVNSEARVVSVVGDAGSGKSRLCFEFIERCRERNVRVYESRVRAHGHATPYQPVLELLRDYFGIATTHSSAEARRLVEDVLAPLPISAETILLLHDFLGIAEPGRPSPKLDPAIRKGRLIQLVRSIVQSGQRKLTVVILVEDLHGIDAASGEFVEAMVDAISGTKTMLLFNFRPGYVMPWMHRGHCRQINLDALNQSDADELLRDLLGKDPSLSLISRHIAVRARGNPFFIEELVRSLVERNGFEGERGAYRLAGGVDTIPLPATIESLLAARIDHLDEPARQVLQYAAVIGQEVPVAILQSVTGWPSATLTEALTRLRHAELLRELPLAETGLHAFRHPLIQEVCYRALLRDRRRNIHADVASVMRQHFTDRPQERASLLAYHLEEAGQSMEAAQAYMRAAFWISTHDSSQALRTWKKVHQLLSTQPTSEATNFLRMQTCLQILGLGWREGMSAEEAHGWFEEAKTLALAANNLRANAWNHAGYGRVLAVNGSADEYVSRTREALALATEANDRGIEGMLKAVLTQAVRLSGHLEEALKVCVDATFLVDDISEFDRQLFPFDIGRWLTAMRGQILVHLGRFDEARPYLDRMMQTDLDANDITLHLAHVASVDLAWAQDDAAMADLHAESAMSMATASGSPYIYVAAMGCRGVSQIISGRYQAAVDDLEKALTFARWRKAGLESEARLLADLADAYRLKGDLRQAERTAVEAIEVATARAARVPQCLARLVHAEVLLQSGSSDRAEHELRNVRALIDETGARIYENRARDLAIRIAQDLAGVSHEGQSRAGSYHDGSCA